jgi:hypothetical protein
VIFRRAESALPDIFHAAALARSYNAVTGASLTHYDVQRMGVLERDELLMLVDNADLVM